MKNVMPVLLLCLIVAGCDDNSSNATSKVIVTPASDCLWIGPFVKENEDLNFAYVDATSAAWLAIYNLPEDGSHITLENQFPYSRYMTFTSYRIVGGVVDQLTDRDIVPNNGSTNPFVEGSPRNDPSRNYLITISPGEPPEDTGANSENTLYDGTAQAGDIVVMFYRNSIPNSGADLSGDTGLPRVTLHMKDGSVVQGEEACTTLDIDYNPAASLFPEEMYADMRGSSDPSQNPPVFRKLYTRQFQWQCDFGGDCNNNPPESNAGFPNADTAYMYAFLSRQQGDVLVMRGKIPQTPKTLDGNDAVFEEEQLRY
jgi:hypothetical protein